MEKLTITTPSDVLSFIGHTLGFWPQESLVCITLNENSIGATLRIDLPRQAGQELPHARTVAHYLTSDTNATSILFAIYTSETAQHGQAKPHAGTIAALTGILAQQGIAIRDGLFVGDETLSPYDGEPGTSLALPVSSTQTSAINAESIYRGSFIEPTNRSTLPTTGQEAAKAVAVEHHIDTIAAQPTNTALQQGRKLWANMFDSNTFPNGNDCHALVANLQFPAIRDWLIADIPGVDEPMQRILFAQADQTPKWSRIEWAQQLLLHAYARTSPEHAAPVLTAIGYINWWEGRGSKAHPVSPARPRHQPCLPPGAPQRSNDRLRHRRRLEHEQRNRLQNTALPPALRNQSSNCQSKAWPKSTGDSGHQLSSTTTPARQPLTGF
ncbi:uncharacterized protein DUF4192 [Arthrobacter sp. SLBN-100]|uniref:DUF4192 family protein n=1 Tax=Arthrobacter sp. SLBN-100 TaxID=2768450 RepID=UPI0011673DBE|nr:DUF4192 family protein [Arthrobacter sp. SLBN-100]TQJ67643.1 uncharacterized protein DUF4192 [Arthrobacter sp. SLBN-100]